MDAAMAGGALQVEGGSPQPSRSEKRHKSLMSQVNARIETSTKGEADAAFAHAGLAPSEAIRALYARAAGSVARGLIAFALRHNVTLLYPVHIVPDVFYLSFIAIKRSLQG